MDDEKMKTRTSDDPNTAVLRTLPFWPTVWGVISISFAAGMLILRQEVLIANVSDQKSISLSISRKLNDMQIEQAVQGNTLTGLSQRVTSVETRLTAVEARK